MLPAADGGAQVGEVEMGDGAMVEVTIDRKKISIDAGATVLEAARGAGIHIPTLCYHAHLTPVGACRVCLVEVEGATDPVASCVTKVRDGMVVKTDSARIRKMRRAMVELVLVDHPLDCPVCDKAGECELQDIAFELGITESQYEPIGANREIDEINHFIGRYPNRCILCGRCVRACEELEGASVMSYVQRHGYAGEIACVSRDTIECEQCGQCLRVCPVGALIGLDFKYRARAWELAKTDTTCPHCGVGCTLTLNTKQGRIARVTSESAESTGNNLCVRGRFGADFVQSEKRLTQPMIRKDGELVPVGWDEALDLVASKFEAAKELGGAQGLAVLGSARATNEESYVLQKLARCVFGTNNVDFSDRATFANTLSGIADVLGEPTAATNSLESVADCDAILVVDADVSEINPMFSLWVQRAVRQRGAKLIVLDGRRTKLARFATTWLPIAPGSEDVVLGAIVRRICDKGETSEPAPQVAKLSASLASSTLDEAAGASGVEAGAIAAAADAFAAAGSGAVIISGLAGREMGRLAANLGLLTGNAQSRGGVYAVGLQCNWQGALDMGMTPSTLPGDAPVSDTAARGRLQDAWQCQVPEAAGLDIVKIMDAATAGAIRAAYVVGDDPTITLPGAMDALAKIDFLVLQDILEGPLLEVADVVLPSASFAEKRGTFTNMERAIQRVRPAIEPPGEARRDLRIIADIAARMGFDVPMDAGVIMDEIAAVCPTYSHVSYEALEEGAVRRPVSKTDERGAAALFGEGFAAGHPKLAEVSVKPALVVDAERAFRLATGQKRFHSGPLSRAAKGLAEMCPEALVEISPEDAAALGLKDATSVRVSSSLGTIEAKVKVTTRSLPGAVFLPFGFSETPVGRLFGWNGAARVTKAAVSIAKV